MTQEQAQAQEHRQVTEYVARQRTNVFNMLTDKYNEIINGVVSEVKPVVDAIEARPMTTQNHYGDYMGFLSRFDNDQSRMVMSVALLRAGGNAQGIIDAVKLLKG